MLPVTATRCVLRAYSAAKCDCGRGSAPDPAGGAYSAHSSPPCPLAGFKGNASQRGNGRAADWLRPALTGTFNAHPTGREHDNTRNATRYGPRVIAVLSRHSTAVLSTKQLGVMIAFHRERMINRYVFSRISEHNR